MELFTQRYKDKIRGVISCYDRVVLRGTLPSICHADAATSFLKRNNIRLFDYPKWAEQYRDELRNHTENIARDNNIEIEFIKRVDDFRKEKRIKELVGKRGSHPGLVHIFSAMEPCDSYRAWHDKVTHVTKLKSTPGKCLHYYFYFINDDLGLCYLRVPTWAPFRLQFYYNGHNELSLKLKKEGIPHEMLENAFINISDFERAQALADIRPDRLHMWLNRIIDEYCPVVKHFGSYHWSIMQLEYATDIIFKKQSELKPIYEEFSRTAVLAVKAEDVATFLGRKLSAGYEDEIGNNFQTRIEGTKIKHRMGKVSIKMYDKHGLVLRIETTTNDVSFFKHHRRVEHRDGSYTMKVATVKKSIYSLHDLIKIMSDSNKRYIEFLSCIDDPTPPMKDLDKISRPSIDGTKTYRGFNLFHGSDLDLFISISNGKFNISGFSNRHLQELIPDTTGRQVSWQLKRLKKHGLIKKIKNTYKYYLTSLGKRVIYAALKLREMAVIPLLRGQMAT
jgi:hypothetical protein